MLRINLSYAAILLPLAVVIAMACSPQVIPFVASAPRWVGLCGAGGAALSPALLVMLCIVLRFADGYSTPLCYRTVADPFPERARAEIIQYAGVVAILVAMVGVWLVFALVETRVIRE